MILYTTQYRVLTNFQLSFERPTYLLGNVLGRGPEQLLKKLTKTFDQKIENMKGNMIRYLQFSQRKIWQKSSTYKPVALEEKRPYTVIYGSQFNGK